MSNYRQQEVIFQPETNLTVFKHCIIAHITKSHKNSKNKHATSGDFLTQILQTFLNPDMKNRLGTKRLCLFNNIDFNSSRPMNKSCFKNIKYSELSLTCIKFVRTLSRRRRVAVNNHNFYKNIILSSINNKSYMHLAAQLTRSS